METVKHPKHYNSHPSGIECIKIAEHMSFCLGNVLKYVWRVDDKKSEDPIEDLLKAREYLDFEIARRQREQALRRGAVTCAVGKTATEINEACTKLGGLTSRVPFDQDTLGEAQLHKIKMPLAYSMKIDSWSYDGLISGNGLVVPTESAFKIGDRLYFHEFDNLNQVYTGRHLARKIVQIIRYGDRIRRHCKALILEPLT